MTVEAGILVIIAMNVLLLAVGLESVHLLRKR
jgi:hypothetical protein